MRCTAFSYDTAIILSANLYILNTYMKALKTSALAAGKRLDTFENTVATPYSDGSKCVKQKYKTYRL